MKTIHMGLNTEPVSCAEEALKNWSKRDSSDEYAQVMIEGWKNALAHAKDLENQIIGAVEKEGQVALSWSCTGRTRHTMHACQWEESMPQYKFDIGENYHCVVSK